jgi:hypothetical protein
MKVTARLSCRVLAADATFGNISSPVAFGPRDQRSAVLMLIAVRSAKTEAGSSVARASRAVRSRSSDFACPTSSSLGRDPRVQSLGRGWLRHSRPRRHCLYQRAPRGHSCLPGWPNEPPASGTTAPRAREKTLADAKRDLLRVAVVRVDAGLLTHLTCMRHVHLLLGSIGSAILADIRTSHACRIRCKYRSLSAAAAGGAAAFADVTAARRAHLGAAG